MLVVNRFRVAGVPGQDGYPDGRDAPAVPDPVAAEFAGRARAALAAFAACPGFADGRLGRSADDPTWWCLVTRWDSVGAYRRALGSYQVKLTATPLLAEAVEEPSAFEVLAGIDRDGKLQTGDSDRSPAAGSTAIGDVHRTR